MRKFWVIFFSILVTCVIGVSMIFIFSTRETIKISADVMYVNVGDEFELNVERANVDKSTTITASSSDASIVSYDNGLCVAKTGGVARITFTTSNARYRNLYCDVMVGDGSMENPYYINNAEQLANIGQPDSPYSVYSYYKLTDNIDFSNYEGQWTPIAEFAGRFDGNGYTISNIMIGNDQDDTYESIENVGIFGTITSDGAVYNLKVDNFFAFGKYTNVGTIAGINYGVIERVEVKNTFLDVEAETIGGIVGRIVSEDNGSMYDNRNTAIISKTSANVIIGQERKFGDDTITYVNKGATGIIGGIAGQSLGGTISNTYSIGKVVLGESNIIFGGLVGDNQYSVSSIADPATNSFVVPARVENSYSAISLFSNKVNNYSIESIGGVVGQNNDILESVESDGVVINLNSNNLSGLYYDKNKLNISETSNIKMFDGIGKNIITDDTAIIDAVSEEAGYVLGCTTNTMKAKTTYKANSEVTEIYDTNGKLVSTRTKESNWDFENVWQLNESTNGGYPHLTYMYVEDSEDDTNSNNRNYIILDTYTLTITQGDVESEKAYKGLCSIVISDNTGKVVEESTASSISINVVEGFRVSTNSKGIVIYDLDNNVYYNITYKLIDSSFKFNSIELDDYTKGNNGSIKEDGNVSIWFRNINHSLKIIDSKNNKTIKTTTLQEGASLSTYINSVKNSYKEYSYIRFNTSINGTGSSYTSTSRMPNKDLTLYVLYSNGTSSDSSNNGIIEDNNGSSYDDNDEDYDNNYDYEETYKITSVEDWNNYVVKYGDNSNVIFKQTRSFVIDSDFETCSDFAGIYDGNGYTITVRGTLKDFALFDNVESGASISELNVEYSKATIRSVANETFFGAIANVSKGTIMDCNVSGTINLDNVVKVGVAGIVGQLYDGSVINCSNEADINAEAQIVAGIVANMRKGKVTDCSNSGEIMNDSSSVNDYSYLQYGTVMASGIVGYMYGNYSKTVDENNNNGNIKSSVSGVNNGSNSAGIVAYLEYGTVKNNSNEGTIESAYQSGGIVTYMCGGSVERNSNTGNITAYTTIFKSNVAAGGVVAKLTDNGKITGNMHADGSIKAVATTNYYTESYAGGIVGAMFYGGTCSDNVLSNNVKIHSTGVYAFAAGGVARIYDSRTSYHSNAFPTNWKNNSEDYITYQSGLDKWINDSVNYKA